MNAKEIAIDGVEGLIEAAGMVAGSLLLLGTAGVLIAWDIGAFVAPRFFERRQPLIQGSH